MSLPHKQKAGLVGPQRPSFVQDMSLYTTVSSFAQRVAHTRSWTEQIVRKSIKPDGQGTELFVFAARKWSHFSAWQRDVDWYCWCFVILWFQLSHSREHQDWPCSLCTYVFYFYFFGFPWGDTCSFTSCVCVSVHLSVHPSCPPPSPVIFEPMD